MSLFLAALLKPSIYFAWLCALASVVICIRRWMPAGKVKSLLLLHIWD